MNRLLMLMFVPSVALVGSSACSANPPLVSAPGGEELPLTFTAPAPTPAAPSSAPAASPAKSQSPANSQEASDGGAASPTETQATQTPPIE